MMRGEIAKRDDEVALQAWSLSVLFSRIKKKREGVESGALVIRSCHNSSSGEKGEEKKRGGRN